MGSCRYCAQGQAATLGSRTSWMPMRLADKFDQAWAQYGASAQVNDGTRFPFQFINN